MPELDILATRPVKQSSQKVEATPKAADAAAGIAELIRNDISKMLCTGAPTVLDHAHRACGMLTEDERHSLGVGLTELIYDGQSGRKHFKYNGLPLRALDEKTQNFLALSAFGLLFNKYIQSIRRKSEILHLDIFEAEILKQYLPDEFTDRLDNMLAIKPTELAKFERQVARLEYLDNQLSYAVKKSMQTQITQPPGKTRAYASGQTSPGLTKLTLDMVRGN